MKNYIKRTAWIVFSVFTGSALFFACAQTAGQAQKSASGPKLERYEDKAIGFSIEYDAEKLTKDPGNVGVQSVPVGWFTRNNFGGRFSSMLKFAGWDGIVIEGKADAPVWLDIRNDRVKIIKDGIRAAVIRPARLWNL